MGDDPTFKVIPGGKAVSEETENASEAALGLELMKAFLILTKQQKLQVIQFASELESSSRPPK
jgi:hypothetical protein